MAQPVTQPQSTAIVQKSSDKMATLRHLFEAKKDAISAVCPKFVTPERIIKITLAACSRNPQLLACTPASILMACIQAAELGLEFGNVLGHAYLVPYENKKNKTLEATFIPGYRGLIALARRSGQILSIEAHVVYEKDRFEVTYGLDPKLVHVPTFDEEPGAPKAVYAVAVLRDGAKQSEVMTKHQVDAIRKRSAAANAGPWVTDYEEMMRKTVVKRLWKYLPMSTEMVRAIEADDALERAEPIDLTDVMHDPETGEVHAQLPEPSGLKDTLKAKAEAAKAAAQVEREPGADG